MIYQEELEKHPEELLTDEVFKAVRKNGIFLLEPMCREQRKKIHLFVSSWPDATSFSIGLGDTRRVALRYKPYIGYLELQPILNAGEIAYQNKDYIKSIKFYRQLLQYGNPKPFIYARLGVSYMKLWRLELAIDYFIIANELSKTEDFKFDFTDLIESLRKSIKQKDITVNRDRANTNPEKENSMKYECISIEQIATLMASGMTINDACSYATLNEEQIGYVMLMFAKECFMRENDSLGDFYLKQFEQSKNKSKFTQNLFEQIRRNKRFYKNSEEEKKTFTMVDPRIKRK